MPRTAAIPIWIAILTDTTGTSDAELLRSRPQWDTTSSDETWHIFRRCVIDPTYLPCEDVPRKEVWFTIMRDPTGSITVVNAATVEPGFDLTPPPGHSVELRCGFLDGGDSTRISLRPLTDAMAIHRVTAHEVGPPQAHDVNSPLGV